MAGESGMKLPITVAVCTLNAEKYIEQCLDAIMVNEPAQIIVVDGCSSDKTWLLIKDLPITTTALFDKGLPSQRQMALDYTSQPYHMIVDAHHRLGPNCLRDLLNEMRKGDYHAIQAREWQVPSKGYWTNARASANFDITNRRRVEDTVMVGRPALYRTESLRAVGGFDSDFDGVGDEDTDVSIRMELAGYRQGQGTGIARRVDELDFHSMIRKFVKYGRGDARIIQKYPSKRIPLIKHLLWTYPWVRGMKRIHYWPYFALCGWVRFAAMVWEMV